MHIQRWQLGSAVVELLNVGLVGGVGRVIRSSEVVPVCAAAAERRPARKRSMSEVGLSGRSAFINVGFAVLMFDKQARCPHCRTDKKAINDAA